MKVQHNALDRDYLTRWAAELEVITCSNALGAGSRLIRSNHPQGSA